MSESFMFALLGFLIACLFGTVFASLLWRRAVTVTKRSISQNENVSSLEDVASLKAEMRDLQNSLRTTTRETETKNTKIAALEEEKSTATANIQAENEALREELKAAGTALETAIQERDNAQTNLEKETEAAKAHLEEKTAELAASRDRVRFLENSIRTLAKNAADLLPVELETSPPASMNASGNKIDKPDQTQAEKPNAVAETPTNATSDSDERNEPTLDVTRSLEARIEALKQGQTTH